MKKCPFPDRLYAIWYYNLGFIPWAMATRKGQGRYMSRTFVNYYRPIYYFIAKAHQIQISLLAYIYFN